MVTFLNDSYEWEDILDTYWNFRRSGVKSYDLPSFGSVVTGVFSEGDPVFIEYYTYVNGVVWVGFYQWNLFSWSWIPLTGSPGSDVLIPQETIESMFYLNGDYILTHEEEQAQEDAENANVVDSLVSKVGTIVIGGIVLNGFFNYISKPRSNA